MSTNFKIKKQSAADLVYEKMKEFIMSGQWPIHEKVPSEAELSETFGVNRLTVRIALQKLNTLGVLDTRVGDGTYVRSFNFDTHMHDISDFYMSPKVMDDVQEYRILIQMECARLAIERATEEEIAAFGNWCDAFEAELAVYDSLTDPEARRASLERTVDCTLGFQTQLCKMSHNDLLIFSFAIARDPIRKHMLLNAVKRIDEREDGANIWAKEYRAVCSAMESRDLDRCLRHFKRIITMEKE